NPEDMPILWIGVWGTRPLQDISEYIRKTLKDQFQTIPGVGDISMSGYRERNVRVCLDAKLLQSYDLTIDEVMAAISREHIELPAGRIETASRELNIRAEVEASSIDTFLNLIIADLNGAQIHQKHVAIIENGMQD